MRKTLIILAAVVVAWGCATVSPDYRAGVRAEMNKNYDEAVQQFEKAVASHPQDEVYRVALARAKASASLYHIGRARVLAEEGKKKEAGDEYGLALFYNPRSRTIQNEMKALQVPAKPEKSELEMVTSPIQLKNASEKVNLSFRTPVSVRSIFDTLSRMFGITFIYDEAFRDSSLAIDLSGKDLDQAIAFLCVAGHYFHRLIDERTVLIAPDTFQKRQQYELVAIRTFYLSNILAPDVMGILTAMLRTQLKPMTTMQVDKNLNSITVRDTPQTLNLVARLLRQWDKAQAEVALDIEIMEVSRTRLRQLGLELSSNLVGVRFRPTDESGSDEGWIPLKGLGNKLGDLANYQIAFPDAALEFLESDNDTKYIAQPRIRGVTGKDMHYLVGQKVPIINSQFSPIITGSSAVQPIVNFTFQDVGVELTIKPQVHIENEVTLESEIKISAISGTGVADIPIIATREIKNTIRLKDGETNMLAGLLRDEERTSLTGITGLKDIPLLGQLFSRTQKQVEQSDVILTITPYIIRPVPVSPGGSEPIWVESDSFAGAVGGQRNGQEDLQSGEEAPAVPERPELGSGGNAVYLSPAELEAPRNRDIRLNVEVSAEQPLYGLSLTVAFDSQVLELKDVIEGDLTRQLGGQASLLKILDTSTCTLGFSSPSLGRGFTGTARLAVLVFTPVGPGDAGVQISNYSAQSPSGTPVVLNTGNAQVRIR